MTRQFLQTNLIVPDSEDRQAVSDTQQNNKKRNKLLYKKM